MRRTAAHRARALTVAAATSFGLLHLACDAGPAPVAPPGPTSPAPASSTVARTTAPAASTSTPSAVPALPSEGCEPRPGVPRRVDDPNGPYGHQVVVASTRDGITLTGARQVLDHASVPDGVRAADGTVLIYYVNGEEGATWVARMDAAGVTPVGPISINGALRPIGVVDPDATLLPDGRIRLIYLGNLGPPRPGVNEWNMCIAESDDGVRFTLVGRAIRFTGPTTTDPSVIRLSDGSWLMATSQGQSTVLARSVDGLRFEPESTVTFGGVPELALLPDGRIRLYTCGRGIQSHLSADGGKTWAAEASNIAPALGHRIVCDPSSVAGTEVFVYKTG